MLYQCLNCKQVLSADDRYCGVCGQQVKPRQESVWAYIGNFLSQVFNTDGTLVRTMVDLCSTSKVPLAYVTGQRKRYIHPFRLLVVVGTLFALLLIKTRTSTANDLHQYLRTIDMVEQEVDALVDSLQRIDGDTSLLLLVKEHLHRKDSVQFQAIFSMSMRDEYTAPVYPNIALRDIATLSNSDLADKYGLVSLRRRAEMAVFKKMASNPDKVITEALSNLIWAFLLTLPGLSLILKLVFRRRYPFLTQHLTFIAYSLSFVLLLVGVGILLSELWQVSMGTYVLILVVVYLLFCIRDFYQLPWWLAVSLSLVLGVLLVIMALFSILALVFVSAFLG